MCLCVCECVWCGVSVRARVRGVCVCVSHLQGVCVGEAGSVLVQRVCTTYATASFCVGWCDTWAELFSAHMTHQNWTSWFRRRALDDRNRDYRTRRIRSRSPRRFVASQGRKDMSAQPDPVVSVGETSTDLGVALSWGRLSQTGRP